MKEKFDNSENLQWRRVGEGRGLCQARQVIDGERRCWKYLSLRNCLNSFEIKTSIKLTNSKTKSPHLLQEEHTHAAVPREKTSRWPESSLFFFTILHRHTTATTCYEVNTVVKVEEKQQTEDIFSSLSNIFRDILPLVLAPVPHHFVFSHLT